jgi:hypothetical protein
MALQPISPVCARQTLKQVADELYAHIHEGKLREQFYVVHTQFCYEGENIITKHNAFIVYREHYCIVKWAHTILVMPLSCGFPTAGVHIVNPTPIVHETRAVWLRDCLCLHNCAATRSSVAVAILERVNIIVVPLRFELTSDFEYCRFPVTRHEFGRSRKPARTTHLLAQATPTRNDTITLHAATDTKATETSETVSLTAGTWTSPQQARDPLARSLRELLE